MKLYEVPRNTFVKVISEEPPPVDSTPIPNGQVVKFHHVDGMYSYCTTLDKEVVHLAAWTEVEITSDPRTLNPQTPT